jgi:hypothetical protein
MFLLVYSRAGTAFALVSCEHRRSRRKGEVVQNYKEQELNAQQS